MMTERQLDPHKVAFVICVNDEAMFRQALGYIQQLDAGGGMSMEVIAIGDAVSMCEGYERARLQSDAKYKIYMHQDVLIWRRDIVGKLVRQFRRSPWVGIIGLAGCEKLPSSAIWWRCERGYNCIAYMDCQCDPPRLSVHEYPPPEVAVEAVDGVFMATQYDVPWRADIFCGWHFYDISQCMEYRRQGYKVALARQLGNVPWIVHMTKNFDGEDSPGYRRWQAVFLREYADEMAGRQRG